jgi:hypothetical protein
VGCLAVATRIPNLGPYFGAPTTHFYHSTATRPFSLTQCRRLCSVTADPGPLNRAEWIKFVAAFFNKEIDANSAFDSIKVRAVKTCLIQVAVGCAGQLTL